MDPVNPQIAAADEILSTKWIIPILRVLAHGPTRFSRIRSLVAGISPNILTTRLRHLEANGLAQRKELPHPADRQVYELTESGLAAVAVLKAVAEWAEQLPKAHVQSQQDRQPVLGSRLRTGSGVQNAVPD